MEMKLPPNSPILFDEASACVGEKLKMEQIKETPFYNRITSEDIMRPKILQINSYTRIRKLDENNLVLEILKTVSSERKGTRQEWCFGGYYGDLGSALISALNRKLINSLKEETVICDLLKEIQNAKNEILEALHDKR